MPAGHDADRVAQGRCSKRSTCRSAAVSPSSRGKVFRIGHLGDFNDLTLMGTLAGVEMGLALAGVPIKKGGVQAAMEYLADRRRGAGAQSRLGGVR